MHTVELLDEALRLARSIGYQIRQECLDGSQSGACVLGGKKLLFLDLADGPNEHLEVTLAVLREERQIEQSPASPQLRDLLALRKSA